MIYKTALFTGESVKIIGYINKKASLVKCIDSRNRFFKTALSHLKTAQNRDFYHVTSTKNIDTIMANGLIPGTGERARKMDEGEAIFLFDSEEAAEDAIMGWLGEEFPEEEKLAILKVSLPIDEYEPQKEAFEYQVFKPIPPEYISIIEKNASIKHAYSNKLIVSKRDDIQITESCRGAHHGQVDCTLKATDKDGNYIGHLDYVEYQGMIQISMISVPEDKRRQGIGTALVEHLYNDNTDKEIKWSGVTEEGAELQKSLKDKLSQKKAILISNREKSKK